MKTHSAADRELAKSILYVTALLRNLPRPIDRYIDYFGGKARRGARAVQPA